MSKEAGVSGVGVRPIAIAAVGLICVVADFRTRSLDLLPDFVGWALVGLGAVRSSNRSAAVVLSAASLLSVSELALPYRFVYFDPESGSYVPADAPGAQTVPAHQRWNDLSEQRGLLIAAAAVTGAVGVIILLQGLVRRATAEGDESAVKALRAGMLACVLWAGPFLWLSAQAAVSGSGYDPVWNNEAESAGLISALCLLGIATLFALSRDRGWAVQPGLELPSPWEQMRSHTPPTSD